MKFQYRELKSKNRSFLKTSNVPQVDFLTTQTNQGEPMSANTRRIFLCLFVFGSSRLAWSQVQVANEQVAAEMLAKSHPVLLQWLENFDDFEWAEYEISGQSVKVLDESGKTWVREISQLTSHSPTVQRHTTRWKGSAHDRDLCGGTWLQFSDRFVDWPNSQSVGPVISIRPNSNPTLGDMVER